MIKKRGKRAVSPIVSTILLIVIVVILAVIIFLWARSFVGEIVEKEIAGVKKTADKFCREVNFKAYMSDGYLIIKNEGDVPIHEINVKKIAAGESDTEPIEISLDAGAVSEPIDAGLSGYDAATITPVLLGKTRNIKKQYTCPDETSVDLSLS